MNDEKYSRLVVVIACLNEAAAIGTTVAEVFKYAPQALVIVADNNSTDATSKLATSSGAKVLFAPAPGKGRAFRTAIMSLPVKFDALLMIDGDGTYDISRIGEAMELITKSGVDLVVGTRKSEDSTAKTYRRGHRTGNKFFSILNKVFHSSEIEDSLSGWRLMSHHFIGTFPSNSKGFEIETEINAHARNFDLKVANIDITYRQRPENSFSKLNTYKDGLRILASNFRVALQNRPLIFLGGIGIAAQIMSIPLIYRAVNGYLKTGLVSQLPSLVVGTSFLIGGLTLAAIGYLLEQMRRMHISSVRQAYFLSVKGLN
jgi:glycosyltransferase involved in cell wall biosynthesis